MTGRFPNDADGGGAPANCVTLKLTVGDPSGSESERWTREVVEDGGPYTPVARHCDLGFGAPDSAEYSLVKGKSYTFKVRWVATNLGDYPDYDWQCLINDLASAGARPALYGTGIVIVEDDDGLLTWEKHGNDTDITIGSEGKIHVPKVESVEWETHEENTPLDTCPQNGGKRIFPDRQTPDDNNASVRRKVTVKARITPALENQTVYFRAFDADDPSSDESPVDGNDASGPAGGDNKGAGHALSAASAQTDASGCASVEFTVSMQPGDNFKMFASLDGPALNSLTQDEADAGSAPSGITQSEMLTVWRRLWLERDSMGPIPEKERWVAGYVNPDSVETVTDVNGVPYSKTFSLALRLSMGMHFRETRRFSVSSSLVRAPSFFRGGLIDM
jgi:hypothetical protein